MENEMSMSVAKVSDIVSELTKTASVSLDNAIAQRIAGGAKTLRDLRVWWIKEARVTNGSATQYQVNMMIGFVIDD
jgi:flavin-binding protein dodecin